MEVDQTSEFDRLVVGGTDRDHRSIVDVYALQTGRYAVYQTHERVVVLLADDPLVQQLQRKRLAGLATIRSEINGALAYWRRASQWSRLRDLALQMDMVMASALIEALEGATESALAILQQVARDIACERASRARLYYLACTIGVAAMFLIVCLVATGVIGTDLAATNEAALGIWRSVTAGVLGAGYSIALGIEKRDVTNDRRRADHVTDAFVRICIGALAAFVLATFLLTGAVELNFGDTIALTEGKSSGAVFLPPWPVMLIAGFLAGFAERLVPDLLNSYAIRGRPSEAPAVAAVPTPAAATSSTDATPEINGGQVIPDTEEGLITPPSPEEEVDGCDVDLANEATATPDEALPPASGGITAPTGDR